MLNTLAALGYLLVALMAVLAWTRDSRRNRLHWCAVAILFCGLAAWRLSGGEAVVQHSLRAAAASRDLYQARGEAQRPLIAMILLIGAPALLFTWWQLERTGQARGIAVSRLASLALLAYTILRAISLHAVDALIYHSIGPIHVNYLIDGSLALTCLLGAGATVSEKFGANRTRAGVHGKKGP